MAYRPWVVPMLAGLLAVVLAAGVAGVAFTDSSRRWPSSTTPTRAAAPGATSTTANPSAATTTPPAADSVEAFIPVAERFVEQHRGLTFKQPPAVTFLDDAAFRDRLLGTEKQDKEQLDKTTKVLRALGLIPAGTDVGKAESSLLGDAVAGFYDTKTKALVVRGAKATPYVRQVLVHELTHALQDQYFAIDHPELDNVDDERPDGLQGLVEGDAVRVDGEYRASLSTAEQRQAAQEEDGQAGGVDPNVPDALIAILAFPYQVGPAFTKALIRAGGMSRLNAAFTSPPTTTEQLLHPNLYLAGEAPLPVTAPPADGKVIDTGVLGEFGFALVLGAAGQSGGPSARDVALARTGWGGDRYVAWNQGSQACVRDRVAMDTANDTQELLNAFHQLAGTRRGLTIEGTGPVTITSCG
ncbi:MAG: hypothetical protein QOG64_48 [Acidimicrobiaceae bacterium]|nr:hypothetical protein [Acidimicrobiaceae bacterium]